MSLFKRSKATMIPQLEVPEDKNFEAIEQYKENEKLDDPKDMDFPLPKPENMYLKIDEYNDLEPIDEKYISNIFDNISSYRDGEIYRFDDLLKTVKEIFEKICGSYYDLFDFSSKMAKKLEVTKEHIELCYEVLLNKKNATTLDLDAETLGALGRMISYSYTKIDQYKIKDMKKLEEAIDKVMNQKINIYDQFVKWCAEEKKDPKNEKLTEFLKKRRKNYDLLPELIFLVNHFSKITTVNIELDKIYNPENSDDEYKFFEIAVLNLHWILNSLENINFNLICRQMQSLLFKRYQEKTTEACNKINDIIKPKDKIFSEFNSFQRKWNFLGNLKLTKFDTKNKEDEVLQSKTLEVKEKKSFFSAKTFGNAFKKIATFGENIINLSKEKGKSGTRVEIVRQNFNMFEFIITCIFSLNEAKNGINIELVMNDTFNGEFFLLLNEIYKFEWITKEDTSEFHIFDLLLFNKVINNIQRLNIEINCLDIITFNKMLSFLYFSKSLTKFNMSLFSSDFIYIPEFIYKIYSEIHMEKSVNYLKRNYDEDTYLFCNIKDMENKILDQLYPNFVNLIATLFEIINNKKQFTEIGFNIDVPKNIKNKENYMNAIYKFILNAFFYVTRNEVTKFSILSPYTEFNSILKPDIDEVVKSINFSQHNSLEELTLQLNFVELQSIDCFIIPKLKILNIGNLDLVTLEYLCNVICSYRFNNESCLENFSIGLSNNITEFNPELKKLFLKIFQVKIKELETLTLLTNLDFTNKKEYDFLLSLLNYNWIHKYVITFNGSGEGYNTDEIAANMKFLVPNLLASKLVSKRELKVLEDIKDKTEFYYWGLKYMFNVKMKDNPLVKENKKGNKKLIFDILKYINIVKSPELTHIYSIKN